MELVPHGQYAVNPYWLSVITSLRILTYRTPEGKPLGHPMPKTSCQSQKRKKNFLEAERTNALPATYCLNLSWLWATHKTVFRGEGTDRLCKSKASKGLGSRELVESLWMIQVPSRRAQRSCRTCTDSVLPKAPDTLSLSFPHLSPFCLQHLESTLAFLIRQFGRETSLFSLRDKNKNVSDQNFHIWSQMIDEI